MYRDDLEALKARAETLESATNAERKAREAAEAAAHAARVRADELKMLLERTRDEPDPPFLRRHGLTVVALVVAIGAVSVVIWQRATFNSVREDRDALHDDVARARRKQTRAEGEAMLLRQQVKQLNERVSRLQREGRPRSGWGFGAVAAGVLDRNMIRRVVATHMPAVRRCYEEQLIRHPDLEGKIVFDWVIGDTGRVTTARQVSSTIRTPAVASCILQQIRTWSFPRPADGNPVTTRYPFVFRTSGVSAGATSDTRKGYLVANTIPWARVLVDGKDTGLTTPIAPRRKIPLDPGRHRVTFQPKSGKRHTFTVTITEGQITKLIKRLPE